MRSKSNDPNEYADVAESFRHLATLDAESPAFRRQRDAIIARCMPLADHIARRFRNRGEPIEDLVQVARVGLVNAVNRFDISEHTDFLAYAVPTITGEVRRHFRDHGWAVKVPRRLKDLHLQLNRAREELSHRTGRAPTPTELAEYLGIDREEVVQTIVAGSGYSTLSTDTPSSADDDYRSVANTFGDIDSNLEKVLDIETVRPLLAALPERQQTILRMRFFEDMSQTQIAEAIGVSQMHVSRLLAKSLATLRKRVDAPPTLRMPLPAGEAKPAKRTLSEAI
jgi:RNA polymerase sigma-B factor